VILPQNLSAKKFNQQENGMEANQSYQFTHTVQDQDLASAISPYPEDKFPAVLATSRLIAFMEFCCARFMKSLLGEGELSVGVGINITHTAPTRAGEEVTITATYLGLEGKLYRFKVSAADKDGVVSEGEHTRAVVNADKLLKFADKRAG
jgi:predicted thioesterase